MRLNIQLFADETQVIDTEQLTAIANSLIEVSQRIYDLLGTIASDVLQLKEDKSFNSIAGDLLQEAFTKITPFFGNYKTVVEDLGKFLTFVVGTYEFSDEAMKKEFQEWSTTVDSAIGKIKGGLNSTVAQGSYSVNQYFTDMSTSTRSIVSEVATMIGKTGDLYTSATGKSVVKTISDIGTAAAGTFKTLFGWVNKGNSIATQFLSGLGK